jgi:hypothetical protein
MNIRKFLIASVFALAAGSAAYAGNGTSPPKPAGHVHYCGCGHPGYVAPGCNGGGGTSGGGTSSGWGGSTTSSTGGSTGSTGGSTGSTGGSGGSTGGTNVPEPADFALFALGVAGLIIGRRSVKKVRSAAE